MILLLCQLLSALTYHRHSCRLSPSPAVQLITVLHLTLAVARLPGGQGLGPTRMVARLQIQWEPDVAGGAHLWFNGPKSSAQPVGTAAACTAAAPLGAASWATMRNGAPPMVASQCCCSCAIGSRVQRPEGLPAARSAFGPSAPLLLGAARGVLQHRGDCSALRRLQLGPAGAITSSSGHCERCPLPCLRSQPVALLSDVGIMCWHRRGGRATAVCCRRRAAAAAARPTSRHSLPPCAVAEASTLHHAAVQRHPHE